MLCLLYFSLLLKLKLLLTLLLDKCGLSCALFAREWRLMAFARLGMPMGTMLLKDMLAR